MELAVAVVLAEVATAAAAAAAAATAIGEHDGWEEMIGGQRESVMFAA